MKFDAIASSEIKSTHSLLTANFTRRRRISHCKAIFHPPARVDLVENDRFLSESVVFWCRWRGLNLNPRVVVGVTPAPCTYANKYEGTHTYGINPSSFFIHHTLKLMSQAKIRKSRENIFCKFQILAGNLGVLSN